MQAKLQADDKIREASQWWAATEIALHRYRRCKLMQYVFEKACNDYLAMGMPDPRLYNELHRLVEAAHDWMLMHHDNIEMSATCAGSAEIAARIYYEEHEEREHG